MESEQRLVLEQEGTQLNWTTLLYDHHIYVDSELYRKWDHELHFEGEQLLDKDLVRTRSSEPYFQKESVRGLLKRLATFYCLQNGANYQQGLLEVIAPFALLKRPDFPTRKVYAYFNAFMRRHFPRVLSQKRIEGQQQLPHAILAITLCGVLLRWERAGLWEVMTREQVPLSMVVTQELMTVFAKNLPLRLVYRVYDYFMNRNDKNYLVYMAVALITLKEKEIYRQAEQDTLPVFMNKQLKDMQDEDELSLWFAEAQRIHKNVPSSFLALSRKTGYCERSFFTLEDYEEMLKLEKELIGQLMPLYPQELQANPKKYLFCLTSDSSAPTSCASVRLKCSSNNGAVKADVSPLSSVNQSIILVFGLKASAGQQERQEMLRAAEEVGKRFKWGFRCMAWQEPLGPARASSCELY